jgi:hypothetical protein
MVHTKQMCDSCRRYIYTREFELRVSSIVNKDNFWKTFLESVEFERKNNEICHNAQKTALEATDKRLSEWGKTQLPLLTERSLKHATPEYFENHVKVQRVLDSHLKTVKQTVEEKCDEMVDKITKDPKYHIVTNALLKETKLLTENALRENDARVSRQMDQVTATGEQTLKTIELDYKKKISELQSNLYALEKTQKDLKSTKHTQSLIGLSLLGIMGFLVYDKCNNSK